MSYLKSITEKFTRETGIFSEENRIKAKLLEDKKPSNKVEILYFYENELSNIGKGFTKGSLTDLKANPKFEKRSLLEYLPSQRHPIPYCVVKCEDKYFLIFRENGSGEVRLIGKKGLLGGHIDKEDMDKNGLEVDLIKTIENGLYRELKEEANLTKDMIETISFIGFIKIDDKDTVEYDHLGLVYLIETKSTNLRAIEEGVLSGDWFTKDEILNMKSSLEVWSKLVFENIL